MSPRLLRAARAVPCRGRDGRCYHAKSAPLPAVLMSGTLNATTLHRAMVSYLEALRAHRREIDSLNVYPVPDGDTGTNLVLTQEAVVSSLPSSAARANLRDLGSAISGAS